jgi:asparagine synthase (glutamine-hydrolysing)
MLGKFQLRKSEQSSQSTPELFVKNQLELKSKYIEDKGNIIIAYEGLITFQFDQKKQPPNNYHSLIFDYYKKYGKGLHQYLDGLFLILIYDLNNNNFYIFNNRYQATQLYYYISDDILYFSKELIPLLQDIGPSNIVLNKGSIKSFISNGFTITDQTQFDRIKKLLPSFRIVFEENQLKFENHWDQEFQFDRKPFPDLEKHLDLYESTYQKGVLNYIEQAGTKELGTLMSGGHDTSFVLIQASKVFNKPIHTFTTTFPDWSFDEGPYAENLANKYNGVYHGIPFVPGDLDYIVSLIRANDEPVVGSSLPLHLCAKEAKKYVDTMFAGDGGDTLWAEYYPVGEFHKYIKHLPLSLRKMIHSLSKLLKDTLDWERFWELEHVSSLFIEDNYYKDFMRKLCTYRHFSDHQQTQLFSPDFMESTEVSQSIHQVEFTKENFQNSLIEGKLFNAFYTYQSFHTTKSMEHFGLNFYMPTINKELMQFITSLPESYINGGTTFHRLTNNKKINRRFHKLALARNLNSKEIYNRSFDIPWYMILKPRPEMLNKLLKRLKKRGWYQNSYLDKLFKEFMSQNIKQHELLELKHHGYRIFTLLSQEIWATEYLDGRFTKSPDQKILLEDYLD